jgi:hypothetical protein
MRQLGQLRDSATSPCITSRSGCPSLEIYPDNRRAQSSQTPTTRHLAQNVRRAKQLPIRPMAFDSTVNVNGRRHYASVSAAELQFGQPVHETHPHLLRAGECMLPLGGQKSWRRAIVLTRFLVTPGITAQEYADRRANLAASLPQNGVAILASSDTKYRSGSVFYEFHQEPNFLYLTGFNEPEAIAVIQKVGSGSDYNFHLFLRPKDARAELWDGARSGEQAALDVFNADEVFLLP